MKEKLLAFLHTLTVYDFIYFGAVFLLFILLILITLLLRRKMTLALLILLLALLDVSLGPTLGFSYFHNFLYKNSITVTKVKKLHFVDAVVIEGKLKNESKFDFKSCRLTAIIYKETHSKYKNLLFRLKPLKHSTLKLKNIPKGADVDFKFLIEPFGYKKDINVSVDGVCK